MRKYFPPNFELGKYFKYLNLTFINLLAILLTSHQSYQDSARLVLTGVVNLQPELAQADHTRQDDNTLPSRPGLVPPAQAVQGEG